MVVVEAFVVVLVAVLVVAVRVVVFVLVVAAGSGGIAVTVRAVLPDVVIEGVADVTDVADGIDVAGSSWGATES